MSKEVYLQALDDLLNEYDAYYIMNKYDEKNNTHFKQFKMLRDLFKGNEVALKAINWIQYCYDCFYKDEIITDNESAFTYLKNSIESM